MARFPSKTVTIALLLILLLSTSRWPARASHQPITITSITVTGINDENGRPANQSRLEIGFSQPLEIADSARIVLVGERLNPNSGKSEKARIPILSASRAEQPNLITIYTGQLVPAGAKLIFKKAALTVNGLPSPQLTVDPLSQGVAIEEFTLSSRPFKPTDYTLFINSAFMQAPMPRSVVANQPDEEAIRAALVGYFDDMVQCGEITEAVRLEALTEYDAPLTRAVVPAALLRAALVSLRATFARAAVDSVLTGENNSRQPYAGIHFDPQMTAGNAVVRRNAAGRLFINVNPELSGEPFQAIAAVLAHEALHQNATIGLQEEIIAQAVRTFLWARSLLREPQLATRGTLLVRILNTDLVALLNSGARAFPRIGLLEAQRVRTEASQPRPLVFSGGSESISSFVDYQGKFAYLLGMRERESDSNSLMASYLTAITATPVAATAFNWQTIELIDRTQQVLSNQEAIRLAGILKMK